MLIRKMISILTIGLLLTVNINAETYFGKKSDRTRVTLESLEGRVVMVSFWATWCTYCMKELPLLDAILNQAGEDNLAVVAVNWKEDKKAYRKFVRKYKNRTKIIYTRDKYGDIAKPFDVTTIPFLLIYDHTGKLRYTHRGYGEKSLKIIVNEVNGLLNEKHKPTYKDAQDLSK